MNLYFWDCLRKFGSALMIVGAACAIPVSSLAQPIRVQEAKLVEPGGLETFTTTFHVTQAEEAKAPALSLSNWKGPQGAPLRTYPIATATPTAQPGLWQVSVTLPGVSAVGTYSGRLQVKSPLPAMPPSPEDYEIIFTGSFRPVVTLSQTSTATFKVSNCGGWISWCPVTNVFLLEPTRAFGLEAKNNSPGAVDLVISQVFLGAMPGKPAVALSATASESEPLSTFSNLAPGESVRFSASVEHPEKLDSGAYQGFLRILARPAGTTGVAAPVPMKQPDNVTYLVGNALTHEIQMAVHVRDPAAFALLICILGVMAGRMASTLASPGFDTKLRFFNEYRAQSIASRQLAQSLTQLSLKPADADELALALQRRIDALWRKVLDGTEPAPAPAFESLRTHARLVSDWALVYHMIVANRLLDDATLKSADDLRKRLLLPVADVPGFDKDRSELLKTVKEAITGKSGPEESRSTDKGSRSETKDIGDPGPRHPLPEFFDLIAGIGTAGVKFYHDYGRPILHILLLVAGVIYGVWIHYSTGTHASTFGAGGVGDYAALFIWGITAEFLSKGFSTITFRRP